MTMQHTDLRTVAAIQTATSGSGYFDSYSGGSGRTFVLRCSDPNVQVEIEAGDSTTDSGAGVAVVTLGGGRPPAWSGTNGSAYLRYKVLNAGALGASVTVWVDAPADTQGAAGAVGPNWISSNSWALVTGTAYVATIGEFVKVNTGGAVTVTLPTAVGVAGQRIRIQDATGTAATHNITVATTSSQTVDGAAPAALATNNGGATYVSDGANWYIG